MSRFVKSKHGAGGSIRIFLLFIIIAAAFVSVMAWHKRSAQRLPGRAASERVVYYTRPEFGQMISAVRALVRDLPATDDSAQAEIQLAITSHHIPTMAPFIAGVYQKFLRSTGPRKTFVVIGPDHFERCTSRMTILTSDIETPFGVLKTDSDVAGELIQQGFTADTGCLATEHSIAAQAPFIKYSYPDARLLGVTLSSSATDDDVARLVAALAPLRSNITVIGSIDFSHYLPVDEARPLDAESAAMIRSGDVSGITLRHADSPPSVRVIASLAHAWGVRASVIDEKNLFDVTGIPENTTGYLNVVYAAGESQDEGRATTTIAFVGDIMLSRSVGAVMDSKEDYRWPFHAVASALSSYDITFGNLEGPISDGGRNVGSIYSFRADPKSIEGLTYAGFDVVSVANNHMGDWTRDAFDQTLNILASAGIQYAGGGANAIEARHPRIIERHGVRFGFLGYTALGQRAIVATDAQSGIAWLEEKTLSADVQAARADADVIIVSLHFGEEYETHSNALQQRVARAAIDAGASLVIGHHPHVVQEVEEYHDGLIAYSLGNFIFDQLFSKETRLGGMLLVTFNGSTVASHQMMDNYMTREYQATWRESKSAEPPR